MKKEIVSLAALAVLPAMAETVQLETIAVTAAERTAVPASEVTADTTVITAEAIEEARVGTLTEALSRLGNIPMSANGGPGTATAFYLRGFDAKRTLVLIDGIRYNDITGLSGAQFPLIQLDDVAQIEIIKGAQSGVWGADASAGVINIVTKEAAAGNHADLTLEGGTFNTRKGSLQFSRKTARYDIGAGIARYTTAGFSAAEPKQGTADYGKRGEELGWEKDGYRNTTFNVKGGVAVTERDRLAASFRLIDADYEYDWTGMDATGNGEEVTNRFYAIEYRHDGTFHDLQARYSFSDFNRLTTDYRGGVKEFSAQDRINYAPDAFVRLGGSYQRFEHLTSYGSLLDRRYSATSAYLTNHNGLELFDAGKTIVTESLRYDRYSSFDNQATGKVGLKQYLADDLYVAANVGSGYNVPTPYQLFGAYGDPDLVPESTLSYDLTLGCDRVWVTGFYNRVTDMIEFDLSASAYGNVAGTSTLQGVEAGYRDDFFGALSLDLSYTWLDAKNADGEFLARRPKQQLDAALTWYATEAFDLGLQGQYVGERYDRKDEQGAQTGKYGLFNAVANYRMTENVTVYGKIDNLTDRYYQTVDGYATAKRSYYFGLRARY